MSAKIPVGSQCEAKWRVTASSPGWITIAALTLLAPCSQAMAQPVVDPSSRRAVAMTPIDLPEAIAELKRICLQSDFQHEKFNASIRNSDWRYRQEQGFGDPAPDARRAPQAVFIFQAAPPQATGSISPGQCNMQFVLRSAIERGRILDELANVVSGAGAQPPPRYEFKGETCWRWLADPGRVKRLCVMHWPGTQSVHLALSFQLWTADGERRANLTPPDRPRT